MKLFHLSDLHIGKQLHHYNLAAEQRKTLAQIVALAKSEHPGCHPDCGRYLRHTGAFGGGSVCL